MRAFIHADYGRRVGVESRRASGDIKLTAEVGDSQTLKPVDIVLTADAARALAALLTVAAKEVQG